MLNAGYSVMLKNINMLSKDGIHEFDVEKCIASGYRVNGTLTAVRRNRSLAIRLVVHNVVLVRNRNMKANKG